MNPFGVNLVGQVLSCGASKNATHMRWIINDGVVPLDGIKGCGKNKDGMCGMDVFIKGMKERIEEVDYGFSCNGKYKIPVPDLITDGQPGV